MTGVNFLWHMHQPDYRPAGSRQAILPWVRLHAVRGYTDLLAVVEQHPQAHCTVNFSGILLEQLLEYNTARDYFAELTLRDPADFTSDEAAFVLDNFFSANAQTLVRPQPRYWELLQKREGLRAEGFEAMAASFSPHELGDILALFNLVWIGFTGREDGQVQALLAKGAGYSADDRAAIIGLHDRMVADVLSRYKAAQEQGLLELSFTPYQHPILPLLHDLHGEGHSDDSDPLPEFSYPADAAEHVRRGMALYVRAFGRPPLGAWPAEGSVSDGALTTLADAGVRWAATDQQNIPPEAQTGAAHLTPWRWQREGRSVLMFFRDTRLADNVGFEYARWDPQQAADHLCGNIAALGAQAQHAHPVVSVILDGENPWEAYTDGGQAFLHALFGTLEQHAELECVTPSVLLDEDWPTLDRVKSGSWINGNFDIWSRDREARQAWRLLARARGDLDEILGGAGLRARRNLVPESQAGTESRPTSSSIIYDNLLAAEGSDWFWWYGDTFQSDQKPQFDALFRGHLIAAYELAGLDVPAEMRVPILSQPAAQHFRAPLVDPTIDGRLTDWYEWRGAASLGTGQGAMAASAGGIRSAHYGFDAQYLYLRMELDADTLAQLAQGQPRLKLALAQGRKELCIGFTASPGRRHSPSGRIAVHDLIEVSLDLDHLQLTRGEPVQLSLELSMDPAGVLRFPAAGSVEIVVPTSDEVLADWVV